MESEKRCGEEEVIHRMQLDATHGGDDEHEKEKEEERDGRKETDAAGQRSRLQLLRHGHRDLIPGNQIYEFPIEIAAIRCLMLLGRRKRVVGKIDVFEVRG